MSSITKTKHGGSTCSFRADVNVMIEPMPTFSFNKKTTFKKKTCFAAGARCDVDSVEKLPLIHTKHISIIPHTYIHTNKKYISKNTYMIPHTYIHLIKILPHTYIHLIYEQIMNKKTAYKKKNRGGRGGELTGGGEATATSGGQGHGDGDEAGSGARAATGRRERRRR